MRLLLNQALDLFLYHKFIYLLKNLIHPSLINYFYDHWCFTCMHICVRASDPLQRELQTAVSCHVGAGNETQALCNIDSADPTLQPQAVFIVK